MYEERWGRYDISRPKVVTVTSETEGGGIPGLLNGRVGSGCLFRTPQYISCLLLERFLETETIFVTSRSFRYTGDLVKSGRPSSRLTSRKFERGNLRLRSGVKKNKIKN